MEQLKTKKNTTKNYLLKEIRNTVICIIVKQIISVKFSNISIQKQKSAVKLLHLLLSLFAG